MKEVLFNLALLDATNFCLDNGIDCSGTHLVKDGRGFSYTLMRDDAPVLGVTFHKSSVPTHRIY